MRTGLEFELAKCLSAVVYGTRYFFVHYVVGWSKCVFVACVIATDRIEWSMLKRCTAAWGRSLFVCRLPWQQVIGV